MKIAMIGQKGIPTIYGGIERHVEELSLELASHGHEILVYARGWYTPKAIKNLEKIKIIHTPTIRTKHLDAIVHTFTSSLHAIWQKPDIIHYHAVGPSILAWIPRLLSPKIKVVVTAHCLDRYHQKWGKLARLILHLGEWTAAKFAHQTITVSKTLKNYYLNEYQKSTIYIPNGVKKIQAHPGSAIIEDQWKLAPNKYLLMVSRLVKHKGVHYLLDAWHFAKQQYPELLKDYKLVITGDSTYTDDYVAKLKQAANGDNSIIFTGWQKGQALEQLYANTALLVHPSENEGLPLTVLQAMSYGRPVLVSDIPEHQEIITNIRFWFNNASVSSLAFKIIELIKDKKNLSHAGQQNKKFVEENYHWMDIAKKTLRVYGHGTNQYIEEICYCSG